MAIQDPNGSYDPTADALDTHAAMAGEDSIFDDAANLVTKAIPLTVAAAANGFINTGVAVGNIFGADLKPIGIEDEFDQNYTDFYNAHKTGVEVAGLIGGSLIPGVAGIKLASAATKAAFMLKAGYSTEVLSQATGILAPLRAKVVASALEEITASGTLSQTLQADKYRMLALGIGEQVAQGLVYETATQLTQHGSPLLQDESLGDAVGAILTGGVTGIGAAMTVGGGALEAYLGYRYLSKAASAVDSAARSKFGSFANPGIGALTGGDRAAAIVSSFDAIPTPAAEDIIGTKIYNQTKNTAEQAMRSAVTSLVSPGDEDVANRLVDQLLAQKAAGSITTSDMVDQFTRLEKLGRVDATPEVPTGDVFYANNFKKSSGLNPTLDDLLTNSPHPSAALSKAYSIAPGADFSALTIATHLDTVELPGVGINVAKYPYVKDAYRGGADIFVDSRNIVHINPDSPLIVGRTARPGESRVLSNKEEVAIGQDRTGNLPDSSAPLYSAPLYINTFDGSVKAPKAFNPVTREITPGVVKFIGDLGKPEITDVGVRAGKKTYLTDMSTAVTKDTSDLDDSAKYLWTAKRGLKRGDVLNGDDVAHMEALYKDATSEANSARPFSEITSGWEKRGISIADDTLPSSLDELSSKVKEAKDNLIMKINQEDGGAAGKLSSEALAAKANVPESYILNGMKESDPSKFIVPAEQHAAVNTISAQYRMGNVMTGASDNMIAQGALDLQYRLQQVNDANRAAAASYFRDVNVLGDMTFTKSAASADTLGAGAGVFSFANGGYNSFAQQAERIGRSLTNFVRDNIKAINNSLSPSVHALYNDPIAAREMNNFTFISRSTSEKYTFLPSELATKYKVSPDTAVIESSLVRDKRGNILDWNQNHTPEGFISNQAKAWEKNTPEAAGLTQTVNGFHTSYELSAPTAAFLRAHVAANDARVMAINNFRRTQGLITGELPVGNIYVPPIDPRRYPFVAMVRDLEGKGGTDGGVVAITARSGEELAQKTAQFKDNYQIIYKSDTEAFHKALGDYDYSRNFGQSNIDSALKRSGVINDVFPESNIQATIKNFMDFHSRQEFRTARDYVELNNAQTFAELADKGKAFSAADTSKRGFVGRLLGGENSDPYKSFLNTALAVSPKESYPLWFNAQERTEALFNKAFDTAKDTFFAADKKLIPFEQASAINTKMGLPNAYAAAVDQLKAFSDTAYHVPESSAFKTFLGGAHATLAATMLRLDFFHAMVKAVSTPVLMLGEAQAAIKAGKSFITTELPDGSGRLTPSLTKLMMDATVSFRGHLGVADTEYATINNFLKSIGVMTNKDSEYAKVVDAMTLPSRNATVEAMQSKLKDMTELGAKYTGNNIAEHFSRYLPGYMAYKIFTEAGMEGQALRDNVATMVNRVVGNNIASQRPIALQGPIGSALGMFQAYTMNLFQQIFRHVEEGNSKSLAIMAAMQTSLFGLNGMPGFQMINHAILGNYSANTTHQDAYTAIPDWAGQKLGRWLLYGALSNVTQAGVYTRTDTNPRNATILPINPMDWPVVSGGIKFAGNIIDTATKIANGGPVGASLLIGLEHNALSRPLAGLAQIAQGFTTTSKGQLGFPTRDPSQGINDLVSMANMSRLMGARPLDEAVIMDQKYRQAQYQAVDATRQAALGEAVKASLYGSRVDQADENGDIQPRLSPDQVQKFASLYARAGGRQQDFSRWLIKQTTDANTSTANQVFKANATPLMQSTQKLMGGQPVADFTRGFGLQSASTQTAASAPQGRQAADGFTYVADPSRPGSYMKVMP